MTYRHNITYLNLLAAVRRAAERRATPAGRASAKIARRLLNESPYLANAEEALAALAPLEPVELHHRIRFAPPAQPTGWDDMPGEADDAPYSAD